MVTFFNLSLSIIFFILALFIGASGKKSVPQTAGSSNTTTAPPLEASGERESQQPEKSRTKARQSGSSGRKSPPSDKGSESDSSLPSPPKQPKGGVSY